MSILETINSEGGQMTRKRINILVKRPPLQIEHELQFLIERGLVKPCSGCTEMQYEITDEGRRAIG